MTLEPVSILKLSRLDRMSLRILDLCARLRTMARRSQRRELPADRSARSQGAGMARSKTEDSLYRLKPRWAARQWKREENIAPAIAIRSQADARPACFLEDPQNGRTYGTIGVSIAEREPFGVSALESSRPPSGAGRHSRISASRTTRLPPPAAELVAMSFSSDPLGRGRRVHRRVDHRRSAFFVRRR